MQSTGQTSTQALSFTPMQASVMMYGIASPQSGTARYRWKCKRAALGAQPAGNYKRSCKPYAVRYKPSATGRFGRRRTYSVQLTASFAFSPRERHISTMKLTVNGTLREVDAARSPTLLAALRDQLDLTGSKLVCDRGECGACTVRLDGDLVYALSLIHI